MQQSAVSVEQQQVGVETFRVFMRINRAGRINAQAEQWAILIEQITEEGEDGEVVVRKESTKRRSNRRPVWKEDFYFDCGRADQLRLSLVKQQTGNVEQREQRQVEATGNVILSEYLLNFNEQQPTEASIDLLREAAVVTSLQFDIRLYQRSDVIGAVCLPNLSLLSKHTPVLTSEQVFARRLLPKLPLYNCFNYLDDSFVTGFDELQFFPGRFVAQKKRVRVMQQ